MQNSEKCLQQPYVVSLALQNIQAPTNLLNNLQKSSDSLVMQNAENMFAKSYVVSLILQHTSINQPLEWYTAS